MPDLHYVPRRGWVAFLRRSVGTTGLWLTLIVLIFAIWQVFGTSAPAKASTEGGAFWWQTFRSLVPLLILVPFFLLLVGTSRTFHRSYAAALKSQAVGDFEGAEAAFARLGRRHRWFGAFRDTADYHRAVARTHRGNLAGAIELLLAIGGRRALLAGGLRAAVAAQLALAYALR